MGLIELHCKEFAVARGIFWKHSPWQLEPLLFVEKEILQSRCVMIALNFERGTVDITRARGSIVYKSPYMLVYAV